MAGDHLTAVAAWLTAQPHNHHQLGDLGSIVDKQAPDREEQLTAVRAAVDLLDLLGLVVFYHHAASASVTARHREGLAQLAAGEPLPKVAEDVEPARPLTIIRLRPGEYAAWYRTAMALPAGAITTGQGGALGATPDAALAALRARVAAGCQRLA